MEEVKTKNFRLGQRKEAAAPTFNLTTTSRKNPTQTKGKLPVLQDSPQCSTHDLLVIKKLNPLLGTRSADTCEHMRYPLLQKETHVIASINHNYVKDTIIIIIIYQTPDPSLIKSSKTPPLTTPEALGKATCYHCIRTPMATQTANPPLKAANSYPLNGKPLFPYSRLLNDLAPLQRPKSRPQGIRPNEWTPDLFPQPIVRTPTALPTGEINFTYSAITITNPVNMNADTFDYNEEADDVMIDEMSKSEAEEEEEEEASQPLNPRKRKSESDTIRNLRDGFTTVNRPSKEGRTILAPCSPLSTPDISSLSMASNDNVRIGQINNTNGGGYIFATPPNAEDSRLAWENDHNNWQLLRDMQSTREKGKEKIRDDGSPGPSTMPTPPSGSYSIPK